ncbi:hypothetical protein [Shimia abyssi]|uniref:Stealth protein CR2 n=1 Tax=Shimia abyssi TaxID=1662395 RepID=A0A2P8FAH8_9RHOB|nr:hypothetical protein [Shimia abyssi]PSL18733.1 stealth protein CR2 [Shimia abyssi]
MTSPAPSQTTLPDFADNTMDVVIMWVDDQFPGYQDTFSQYSETSHDKNPNRTRDNLELLRFNLRALDAFLPQMRNLYLFTMRPQVPDWLKTDHPNLRVVHHDEVADPAILPTFNSFSIMSHVHLLPGLSEHYLFLEDDMMLTRPDVLEVLQRDGLPLSMFRGKITRNADELHPERDGPWNHALANANRILNAAYAPSPREYAFHGPRLFQKSQVAALAETFSDAFAQTRATRFRDGSNIPLEYFYPHAMVDQGLAHKATRAETDAVEGYASLENFLPWTWFQLWKLKRQRPFSYTLNDSFGSRPNPRVERYVKSWLNREFPNPSRFERH